MKNFASIAFISLFLFVSIIFFSGCEAPQDPPLKEKNIIKKIKVRVEKPRVIVPRQINPNQEVPADSINSETPPQDTIQSIHEERKLDIRYVKKSFNLHRKSPIA